LNQGALAQGLLPEAAIKPFRSLLPYAESPLPAVVTNRKGTLYVCRIARHFYFFASSIAPAIEDAKIISSKTPTNQRVKPLDTEKSK
jgi:hypothetical protein